jgi:serine O-acetyltransferase
MAIPWFSESTVPATVHPMPATLHSIQSLLQRYLDHDPAARSKLEILLFYPGVKAIAFHRLAHVLFQQDIPLLPRALAELSRFLTGIEIHPGATIGKRLMIDHGMGTVIGETAVIGDDCLLYQGVTLGGTDLARRKRHPTLENHVVVGAGAKVLGDITIGAHSRIGANSVVIESVPMHSTVVGIPGRIIPRGVKKGEELHHQALQQEET